MYISCIPDDDTTLEDKQDEEKMDIQEHDLHEVLGGWTEVEVDAPREFEPKVLKALQTPPSKNPYYYFVTRGLPMELKKTFPLCGIRNFY